MSKISRWLRKKQRKKQRQERKGYRATTRVTAATKPVTASETNGKTYTYYPSTSVVVKPTKPVVTPKTLGWIEESGADINITIPDDVYTYVAQLLLHAGTKEFMADVRVEDGRLTFVYPLTVGSTGYVDLSSEEYALAYARMLSEYGVMSNGDMHSHPRMSAFWSVTDLTDHIRRVQFIGKPQNAHEYWVFVVSSHPDWLGRRYTIQPDGTVSYADFRPRLENGAVLKYADYTYATVQRTQWKRNNDAAVATGSLVPATIPGVLHDWDSWDDYSLYPYGGYGGAATHESPPQNPADELAGMPDDEEVLAALIADASYDTFQAMYETLKAEEGGAAVINKILDDRHKVALDRLCDRLETGIWQAVLSLAFYFGDDYETVLYGHNGHGGSEHEHNANGNTGMGVLSSRNDGYATGQQRWGVGGGGV